MIIVWYIKLNALELSPRVGYEMNGAAIEPRKVASPLDGERALTLRESVQSADEMNFDRGPRC